MFNIDDIVECIDRYAFNIKYGKTYKIVDNQYPVRHVNGIAIYDDSGKLNWYLSTSFMLYITADRPADFCETSNEIDFVEIAKDICNG
jgi:hypothetical protein